MNVNNTTNCSNEHCKHAFGKHYVSYDGTKDGCSHFNPAGGDQRDPIPEYTCRCKGFAVTYRPIRPTAPEKSYIPQWERDMDVSSQPSGIRVESQWDR